VLQSDLAEAGEREHLRGAAAREGLLDLNVERVEYLADLLLRQACGLGDASENLGLGGSFGGVILRS
jgi:hypothetical protein